MIYFSFYEKGCRNFSGIPCRHSPTASVSISDRSAVVLLVLTVLIVLILLILVVLIVLVVLVVLILLVLVVLIVLHIQLRFSVDQQILPNSRRSTEHDCYEL